MLMCGGAEMDCSQWTELQPKPFGGLNVEQLTSPW